MHEINAHDAFVSPQGAYEDLYQSTRQCLLYAFPQGFTENAICRNNAARNIMKLVAMRTSWFHALDETLAEHVYDLAYRFLKMLKKLSRICHTSPYVVCPIWHRRAR